MERLLRFGFWIYASDRSRYQANNVRRALYPEDKPSHYDVFCGNLPSWMGASASEYKAALRAAIERGYLIMHPSGYVTFTQEGADLFAYGTNGLETSVRRSRPASARPPVRHP
jgi:hypothetical protein